ncbi:hypothetical protein C8R45DRAFT_1133988 [Mycena sanguinolenta]|nr:hypothetical protein C8R45DRAFT_1133988 [Mycena sanguinolenta]
MSRDRPSGAVLPLRTPPPPFIPRQRHLRKLVIPVPSSIYQHNDVYPADLTRMLEAAATVTTLALMLPLSTVFVRDFSNLDMLPALECLVTRNIAGKRFELYTTRWWSATGPDLCDRRIGITAFGNSCPCPAAEDTGVSLVGSIELKIMKYRYPLHIMVK